ncbi:MAG: hypothetical protein ACO3FE_16280 [Planctomycetaceae bacterium]
MSRRHSDQHRQEGPKQTKDGAGEEFRGSRKHPPAGDCTVMLPDTDEVW